MYPINYDVQTSNTKFKYTVNKTTMDVRGKYMIAYELPMTKFFGEWNGHLGSMLLHSNQSCHSSGLLLLREFGK